MQEYEDDRWRIISGKVGNGFSATACKDKATELANDGEAEEATTALEKPEDDPKKA
jgi:hypothetical protein